MLCAKHRRPAMKIMRRNDKRITAEAELWQAIDDSPYVVVAFKADEPYAAPFATLRALPAARKPSLPA